MSNGTRVYTVRLQDDLMERVQETMQRRDLYSADSPWTLSDFLRVCVEEKLAKMERSRRSKKRKVVKDGAIAPESVPAAGQTGGFPPVPAGEGDGGPETPNVVQPG
jgi:hypothetical protein